MRLPAADLPYPPHGIPGVVGSIKIEGVARYYKMAGIRCVFHLLCQMALFYPLLYYLIPQFLRKKKYGRFITAALLLLAPGPPASDSPSSLCV